MATKRLEEHEKQHTVEVRTVIEYREWKEARLVDMERNGTAQQQRLAALDRSRPWDFTPEEEVIFMLTPNEKTFENSDIIEEPQGIAQKYRTLTDYYLLTGQGMKRPA